MSSPNPKETTAWHFFHCPQETWEAMYQDCANAKYSIEFEQYILENDSIGRRFMELFIQKAKEGLKVFLICDTFGSSLLYRSKLVRKLRKYGGRLHFYNAYNGWTMWLPWHWFPRTHTKTLLIDSKIAYTGGVCMAERMRSWRDTHIRITGPVALQIRYAFDDIESRIMHRHSKHSMHQIATNSAFRYFLNRPQQNRCEVYEEFTRAIAQAKKYIYITSAFFIPNDDFLKLLKEAHSRGVDIKILVPQRSDVVIADWICLSYTLDFFAAGLRVFHYRQTVLHSKTAIIDDQWGTVGSTNFDVISFFHNREANIVTTNIEAIAQLKRQFLEDLEHSTELTWQAWLNISSWKKWAGHAARILKVFF